MNAKAIWKRGDILSLPSFSKYFLLYLITNPLVDKLGVTTTNNQRLVMDTGLNSDHLKKATLSLMEIGIVSYTMCSGQMYFAVKGFSPATCSSVTSSKQYKSLFKGYPKEIQKMLVDRGFVLDPNFPVSGGLKKTPTPEEVTQYAMSLGYDFDGQEFVDYYSKQGWKDMKGNYVRNWKTKLEKVWLSKRSKTPICPGAPKGYEVFFVEDQGKKIYAKSWVDGKPMGNNFLETKLLQFKYDSDSETV